MTWKQYGSAWKCFGRNIMTEWERQHCVTMLAALIVSFVREDFLLAWKEAWFLLLPKIDDDHLVIRDIIWWKSKQPGCGCRVMETLPRDNGWKLMTTGGTAKAQVFAPLHNNMCVQSFIQIGWGLAVWSPKAVFSKNSTVKPMLSLGRQIWHFF